MSSLNERIRWRYCSRIRNALRLWKSSHHRARKHCAHALDEGLDERVVGLPLEPPAAMADVERIVEQRGVVRSDVEDDRQDLRRVDPRARDVERELADRNPHAPGALVAQTQDALVVGDHDEADVLIGIVAEPVGNPVDVVGREPDAAHVAHDVAVALAGIAHRRRVDDRHELRQVLDEHAVEEHLVAVQERREADVPLEVRRFRAHVLELELHLLLDRLRRRGQETVQAEAAALFGREGEALVRGGILQQPDAALARADRIGPAKTGVECVYSSGQITAGWGGRAKRSRHQGVH
jgi:hypothetical protein